MQNREGVKLENQGLIYRFHWDTWAATTIDPLTRTTATPPEQHQQRHDSNECWVRFSGPTKQQDPDDNEKAIILDNFDKKYTIEIVWRTIERCIQAPSLSHMGDINATELMTLNIKMFNQVTKRSCLEIEQATVSQKNYVLSEPQRKQCYENPYVDIYWYYRIEKKSAETSWKTMKITK